MQVWAQHHDGVAKQVVLTRCGRLVVMNQTHASDVEAHLSSNRSTLEFLILRRLGCDMKFIKPLSPHSRHVQFPAIASFALDS